MTDIASSRPDDSVVPHEAASLADDVFHRLRSDIVMGALEPGRRLRFAELQRRYGVGTSPLREALSRLTADRLVTQETHRGFRVPPLDLGEFRDIARLRGTLEGDAVRASVEAGDEAWEEALILAHRRMVKLGRQEDLIGGAAADGATAHAWEVRHRAFHLALIAACRSAWTLHFCSLLYDQFDRYRRRAKPDRETQAALSAQHDALLTAALDRDAAEAARILADHVARTAEAVIAGLERPEA
jgi:DNA-binding GntR family transcriptional regulator